jgi:hypothetical protein
VKNLRRVGAALLLSVSLSTLAACEGSVSVGAKAVSADELEKAILGNITGDVDEIGLEITCDDDLPAEVDASVDCFGTDADGGTTGFRPTVTSVDGTDVEFDSPLFLTGEEVATQVQGGLEEQGYVISSLECDEAIGEAGSTSSCAVQVEGADPQELEVTVNEVDGLRFAIGYEPVA